MFVRVYGDEGAVWVEQKGVKRPMSGTMISGFKEYYLGNEFREGYPQPGPLG